MKVSDRLLLGGAWLCLALTACMLLGKVYLDSDSLFLEDVATDLFRRGGSWRDWRFPPAPAYAPDMLLYFVGYRLLPTATLHIFFVSACQVLLLALAALWLARQIRPDVSTKARAAVVLLVAATTLVCARSGMWLYFYSTHNHFSTLLFSLLALGLLLSFFDGQNRPAVAGLMVLCCAAAQISSSLFMISFLAPAGLGLGGLYLASFRAASPLTPHRQRLAVALGLLVAGFELAKLCDRLITFNDPLAGRVPMTREAAAGSLQFILQATGEAFSPANTATFAFSLLVAASFAFLAYRLLRRLRAQPLRLLKNPGDWRLAASGLCLALATPINFFGAILSGGIVDANGYRYFSFPIALALLLSLLLIDRAAARRRATFVFALPLWGFALLCLAVSSAAFDVKSWGETALNKRSTRGGDGAAACIDDLAANGVMLDAGLANYWHTRAVETLADDAHVMFTVQFNGWPYFWMSTIGPIRHPDLYPPRFYNFVIVDDPQANPDPNLMNISKIAEHLPSGFTAYPCPAARSRIFVYSGGQLNDFFAGVSKRFLLSIDEAPPPAP